MNALIKLEDIKTITNSLDIICLMEEGFIQYSNGHTVVPPVGELLFEEPKGDVHIKYGYIKNDDYYVIKIASGFYNNPTLGIPSSSGLMLLFNQKTGQPVAILLDEGYLTDIRTAAAGALSAKYFAPKVVKAIGIIGSGIQAKLQLKFLQKNYPCTTVWVWSRNIENSQKFKDELSIDFDIHIAETPTEVAKYCNLIVTTTPSTSALLLADDILPGTHITAVGSDTENKQELESKLLKKADLIISDSISQSKTRGEIFRAIKDKCITQNDVIELGHAIQNPKFHRTNEMQITIADLTGVAVQDIMIAKGVYDNYIKDN